MYWCLVKCSKDFQNGWMWGPLFPEVREHLRKKFKTKEDAEAYLSTLPQHLQEHLMVTQGCDL